MSDLLTFQPGVSLDEGRYLLRSAVKPGRWSVTIHGIRAKDLTAVIIKTPIDSHGKSHFQSAWMRRTFQTLKDLNHPSRARILDWFEQDGRPFLVMKKVKGTSLEQQLQKGPLSEAVALQLIRQVAAGLAGIHSQGLLHRDIQPKNIILRQGVGIPTLVDWGLQLADSSANSLTPFSAPEQLQGGDILKNRLDIYSLAATLYAAVTGQTPTHPTERQHQVPNPDPASLAGLITPRQLQPNLSEATEEAILQGMALNPQQRPATLENWLNLFPLSHSPGATAQARPENQRSGESSKTSSPKASPPITGSSNPGQIWATQPPPSQVSNIPLPASPVSASPVSASQSPLTNPPGFSPSKPEATPQNISPRPTSKPTTKDPSLPKQANSSSPPGTNYILGNSRGSAPQKTAPPGPSEQQLAQSPTLGTVSPSHSSSRTGSSPDGSSSLATYKPKVMVGAARYPNKPPVSKPFRPIRRLTSITVLMASIGLAGGLLLRVLNPGSVAGFSGLGRAQTFPEADWPGETQLDDLPGDVPQPEYDSDRWDESEEALPEVIWDEEAVPEDEVLAIPEERWEEPDRYQAPPTVEDYGEDLEQAGNEDYSEEAYGEPAYYSEYENEAYPEESYPEEGYSEDYSEPYESEQAAEAIEENSYYDGEAETLPDEETWGETEDWNESDSWVEEAPVEWQEEPSISADDFPEPELPPAYEDPIPQGSIPAPPGEDALYEDV